MLTENSFSKYLLYAIGEIILVVIGILIALSINNWNEDRKDKDQEQFIYGNMLLDLEYEKEVLNSVLTAYKGHADSYYHIYNETLENAGYDSTSITYNKLRYHLPIDLAVSSKHEASIPEMRNHKIKELLNTKLKIEVSLSQAKNSFNDFKTETVIPFLSQYGIYDSKAVFNIEKYKFSPLLENNFIRYDKLKLQYKTVEFEQLLVDLKIKTSWVIENLEKVTSINNEIVEALQQELKK